VLFDHAEYDLRCEWGLQGLLHLAPTSGTVIIVDILSFSTAIDIAVTNGASVLPHRCKESAERFAEEKHGCLPQAAAPKPDILSRLRRFGPSRRARHWSCPHPTEARLA
jgi:hypothetical protein